MKNPYDFIVDEGYKAAVGLLNRTDEGGVLKTALRALKAETSYEYREVFEDIEGSRNPLKWRIRQYCSRNMPEVYKNSLGESEGVDSGTKNSSVQHFFPADD